jgi:hypothetical protein
MKRLNKRPFTPDYIAHHRDRLETATDPFTRMILHDLPAEKEAKRRKEKHPIDCASDGS